MLLHALPYLLFALLTASIEIAPDALRPWIDPVRTVLVGGALIVLARRGTYPELRVRETSARGALALAVATGLIVGAAWVPLTAATGSVGDRAGFDPDAGGASLAPVLLGFRLLGFVVVTPVMEELFVRSLVPRVTDALRADTEWRDRPAGAFTPLSFAVSVAFFTLSHPEYLAAAVTGAIWAALLLHTRRLRDCVLSHAIANAWLAVYIVATGEYQWW
jgi:CAAX prenyl protease-like protein